MKKFVIFFSIISLIFSFENVQTQELDPRCITESRCIEQRQQMGAENPEEGFIEKGECSPLSESEKAGFCLPPGKTSTTIAFGGQRNFANIGEFIKQVYNWSVGAGSILAVLVVLVSGIQWIISRGNSQTIKKAKKRIGGAIGGLVILAGSYTILGTINPALLDLRLPQTFLIRSVPLSTQWCQDVENASEKQVAVAVNQQGEEQEFNVENFNTTAEEAECGLEYYSNQSSQNQTCTGRFCNEDNVCSGQGNETQRSCVSADIGGAITAGGSGFSDLQAGEKILAQSTDILDTSYDLFTFAVCKNGNGKNVIKQAGRKELGNELNQDLVQYYDISGVDTDICQNETVGFYLAGLIADRGIATNYTPDWHAIGRIPDTQNCSINLSKTVSGYSSSDCTSNAEEAIANCSCATLSRQENTDRLAQSYQDYLITKSEMERGFTCDIRINRREFPPLINGFNYADLTKQAIATTYGGFYGALYTTESSFNNFKKIADDTSYCTDQQEWGEWFSNYF